MAASFSAYEVFEMAVQIERNGQRFYREAAKKSRDGRLRDLLLKLAQMEADHERTFAKMQGKLSGEAAPEILFDPNDEVGLYLRAAADTQVFNVYRMQPRAVAEMADSREVLQAAIQLEKDSVVYYLGIRDAVPERLGRSDVETIIREEMSHIRLLSDELRGLGAG